MTIIIYPVEAEVKQEFSFTIKESADATAFQKSDSVTGKIRSVEVQASEVYPASGSRVATGDTVGEVTIINNHSQEQTLVATTRLADPKDPTKVIVRLKKTVTVPAGGKLKVPVYPDKPQEFSTLAPQRFIIPGLWQPLQAKIYAENDQTLGQTGQGIKFVAADDLKTAQKSLKDKLVIQAISSANQELSPTESLWPKLVSSDVSEVSYSVQEGEEVSEFTATMKLKAIVVVFDESQVISLAREKIKASLTSDQQLVTVDPKSLSYTVTAYDLDQKTANVKVSVAGKSALGENSELLSKDNLLGKTAEEIKAYFFQYPEVKSVEVKFSPAWLQKTPRIKDKIEIEINK